jgi:hypothetical protein
MLKITIAIAVVFGLQFQTRDVLLVNTKTWEGNPTFVEWTEKDGDVSMTVSCDGKTANTRDNKIFISYLKNPEQPLPTSILYEDGHVEAKKPK